MPTLPRKRCPHCSNYQPCPLHRSGWARYTQGKTRTQQGYGSDWVRIRNAHLKTHPACVVCGRQANQVDHIRPKARGGTNDPSNLQSLCTQHHRSKTGVDSNRGGRVRT